MALQYISVPELDLGQGIDQLSAENKLPPGYSESLVNFDPTPEGYLQKRVGYQGYAGFLPVRVERIEYLTGSTNNLCFYLDSSVDVSSIDLSSIRSTPLILYGKTSEAHSEGDLTTTNSVHYYPSFSSDVRRTLVPGTGTLLIEESEHGQGSKVFVGITESTSVLNNSNSLFTPDSISVNKSTGDVTIGYTNSTLAPISAFVYVKNKEGNTGDAYNQTSSISVGVNTISIPAATHQLSDFNIECELYQDTGTAYVRIIPDAVTIDSSGNVSIVLTNGDAAFTSAFIILSAAPVANAVSGTIPGMSTLAVPFTGFIKDFIYVSCYLEDLITGVKSEVLPDSITVDAVTSTATVTFKNSSSLPASFFIFWEEGFVNTNKICVDASVVLTPYDDASPQLTLWGLDHRLIYGLDPIVDRPGWVTHIDSYRAPTQTRMISGLGGNIFAAETIQEVGTQYLLPQIYPNLRNRILSTVEVGPTFVDTTDTSTRTRGYLQFEGAGEGWTQGISTEWDSGTGWVKYTLKTPSLMIEGSLSTIIDVSADEEDQLTVQQSEFSVNSGVFKIKQVQANADDLILWVENSLVSSSDFDEQDAGMKCGIFTDRFSVSSDNLFIPGDILNSSLWVAGSKIYEVIAGTASVVIFSGATERINFPVGLRITVTRTTNVIPTRTLNGVATVEDVVVGDQLFYSPIERELTVTSIITGSDRAITIDAIGGEATVTLGSGSTHDLFTGQSVLFIQAGRFTGTQVLTTINSPSSFSFATDEEVTGQAGTLLADTLEVDEILSIEDDVNNEIYIQVPRRWIPVEAPDHSGNLPPSTRFRYFDSDPYGDQPIIRSTMVADTMYFTNGDDEVFKYDGDSIYRAGLFRWQPGLFISQATSPAAPETGEITVNLASTIPTAVTNNVFTVPFGDEQLFTPGSVLRHVNTAGEQDYQVDTIYDDGTNGFVKVIAFQAITLGTTPTLSETATFKYYFRLNAVDVNQNIIASAVTGSQDTLIRIHQSTQVRFKLIGMPAWDIYDYDHLEVEIYRTKSNTAAPFYRLATIPMNFDNRGGYVEYIDTDADEVLVDLDVVNSALLGQELGLSWSEPLRAKYITSAGNRLVLGNIFDYPKINVQLVDTGNRIRVDTGSAQLKDLIWTFRKDNTSSAVITDMVSCARYQFKSSDEITIDPTTDIATSTTDFTISSTAHGLVVGNWVYLFHSTVADGNRLHLAGWYQLTSVTTDDFTILAPVGTYTPDATDVDSYMTADDPRDVPVWIGEDGNYDSINGNLLLSTDSAQFIAVRRLANAINTSMRETDISISGQEEFEPWMIANAGGEFNFGQLLISQPKIFDEILELELPTFTGFNIFVNQVKRNSTDQVSSISVRYPSRILISYPNYPEIMDNPTSILDTDSQSAVDINPADGQEITGIIPFFGDSAFGASLQDGVVVVFKTNSVYLVNIAAKTSGQNAVQKLESRGLGLTAPYSLAPTQNGIMFANESGIYRLTKTLIIQPIGRWVDRIWKQEVDRTQLDIMSGHYYTNGAQYKLSVPFKGDASNQQALVYNTTRELTADGYKDGSWTTYDNHPSIGWANLETNAFFASTLGKVFIIRQTATTSDYRDDASAISSEAILRAMDFGDSGVRKAIGALIINFRTQFEGEHTTVAASYDLTNDFSDLDAFKITSASQNLNGLNDPNTQKIETLRFSIDRRKLNQVQIKITNAEIDEPLEISGVTYRVAGMTTKGIQSAKTTT